MHMSTPKRTTSVFACGRGFDCTNELFQNQAGHTHLSTPPPSQYITLGLHINKTETICLLPLQRSQLHNRQETGEASSIWCH